VGKTVNILGWNNGSGLSRDINILRSMLVGLGCTVFVNKNLDGGTRSSRLERIRRGLQMSRASKVAVRYAQMRPPFDLNIHLEDIQGGCLWLAKRNVLIPNQEWFRDWCRPYLSLIDQVWAKTHLAQRLFSAIGCDARLLGWSSVDRQSPGEVDQKMLTGLHIAGASMAKGTEAVLDVWSRNPEWPLLRVLRRTRGYGGGILPWRERPLAPNIQISTDRVDEETLLRWQNDSALCICPSEAEGFGHVIAEGMSVAAVVITTDAPPMNEMVTPGTGLRVVVDRAEPIGLGERYFVNPGDLEIKIRTALDMTTAEREAMGRAARARYEAMTKAFREQFKECLETILSTADGRATRMKPSCSEAAEG